MYMFSRFGPPVANEALSRENKEGIRKEPKGTTIGIVARDVVGFDDFLPCRSKGFEGGNKISTGVSKNLLRKDQRL